MVLSRGNKLEDLNEILFKLDIRENLNILLSEFNLLENTVLQIGFDHLNGDLKWITITSSVR